MYSIPTNIVGTYSENDWANVSGVLVEDADAKDVTVTIELEASRVHLAHPEWKIVSVQTIGNQLTIVARTIEPA